MCQCGDGHYERDPIDFRTSPEDLVKIFSTRNPEQVDIKIKDEDFSFVQMTTVDKGMQYSYTCSTGNNNHAFLLKEILQGDKITIDSDNAVFLADVAEVLQITELTRICTKYQKDAYIEPSCSSFIFNLGKTLAAFFKHCSTITKVFMTLWDIIGVGVVLGFFLNSIILAITMAIYIAQYKPAIFIFVMLPLSLYSFFFINIMNLVICEFFKFQMFKVQSPLSSIQILFMKLIRLTKLNRPTLKLYFKMPNVYNIFLGMMFVVFALTFVFQAFSRNASKGVSTLVFIAGIILPTVKYFAIILVYSFHSYASCIPFCRKRFIDVGDFNDPFLNAMYLRPLHIPLLIAAIKNKNIKTSAELQEDTKSSDSESDNSLDNLESNEDSFIDDNGTEDSIAWLVVKAIFSRFTFTIFAVICLLSYLLSEFKASTSQTCGIVFGFDLVILPLACTIVFPFFWWNRQHSKPMTKARLLLEKEELHTTNDYHTYAENLVIWDPRFTLLRWSSLIITFCVFFIFFLFIVFCIAIIVNPNYFNEKVPDTPDSGSTKSIANVRDTWFNISQPPSESADFRLSTNPICFTKVKGLTSEQVMALAISSYYSNEEDKDIFQKILKEYFGKDWNKYIQVIKAPFPDKTYQISMVHYKIPSLKLIVFAIKGTTNLNEVLADIELWCSSVVFDLISKFTPFIGTYVEHGRVMLESLMAMPRFTFKQFSLVNDFVDTFSNYIDKAEKPDDYDMLVTGHSLGGGLAKIIALKTGIQAFSISGPGVKTVQAFYEKKSNITKDVMSTFINVVPAQDYVSMVDTSYSQSKYFIPCSSGFIKCHSSSRTICQTNILCGNREDHEEFCRELFPNDDEYNEMIKLGSPVHL